MINLFLKCETFKIHSLSSLNKFIGNFFVLPYTSFLSIRFIVGLVALMTVILFSSYTTTLISFLTVQKLKPVVNSFQELASSKEYQLVVPLQAFISTVFLVGIALKNIIPDSTLNLRGFLNLCRMQQPNHLRHWATLCVKILTC